MSNFYQKGIMGPKLAIIALLIFLCSGGYLFLDENDKDKLAENLKEKIEDIQKEEQEDNTRSLIKEKIDAFIQEDIGVDAKESSEIYPNEFILEEMLQKEGQQVGGMTLTKIEHGFYESDWYLFMFTGPIELSGYFYNYPEGSYELTGYTCFDTFSEESKEKLPRLIERNEDWEKINQDQFCIKTESNDELGESGNAGSMEMVLNKYIIIYYSQNYYYFSSVQDKLSPMNYDLNINRIIDSGDSSTWDVFRYELEDATLEYRIDPKIRSESKYFNCSYGPPSYFIEGDFDTIFCGEARDADSDCMPGSYGAIVRDFSINIIRGEDLEIKEWFEKVKLFEENLEFNILDEYQINGYSAIYVQRHITLDRMIPSENFTIIKVGKEYIIIACYAIEESDVADNLTLSVR